MFIRRAFGVCLFKVQLLRAQPSMLLDQVQYDASTSALQISGFLRGRRLSPAQLIHIVGCGTYQMTSIALSRSPLVAASSSTMNSDEVVLSAPPAERAALDMENEVDGMANEQTWPTEEELAGNAHGFADDAVKKKKTKRVPKGTSDYQAAWYLGSDDERGSGSEDEEDEDGMDRPQDDESEDDMEDREIEPETHTKDEGDGLGGLTDDMNKIDFDEIEAERKRRQEDQELEEALEFPDEVDTPLPPSEARIRFARYRGLKSFRSSYW